MFSLSRLPTGCSWSRSRSVRGTKTGGWAALNCRLLSGPSASLAYLVRGSQGHTWSALGPAGMWKPEMLCYRNATQNTRERTCHQEEWGGAKAGR